MFVGNNGCGKTTFLEGLFCLCGATNPILSVNTNLFRGLDVVSNTVWRTFFRNCDTSNTISIEGNYQTDIVRLNILPHQAQKQSVKTSEVNKLISNGADYTKTKNEISGKPINGLTFQYSSQKSKSHQSDIFVEDDKLSFREKAQVPINAIFVSAQKTSDAKNQFGEIQRQKKKADIIKLLQELDSRIVDLSLNEISLIEADIGLDYLIPVTLMGGGISKCLNIALSMYCYKDGIVIIDEIENGLHYLAQNKIWEAIFAWANKLNVQVFASTHSFECINAFYEASQSSLFENDSKLFRIERDFDTFKCVEYKQEDLKTSIENMWEVR